MGWGGVGWGGGGETSDTASAEWTFRFAFFCTTTFFSMRFFFPSFLLLLLPFLAGDQSRLPLRGAEEHGEPDGGLHPTEHGGLARGTHDDDDVSDARVRQPVGAVAQRFTIASNCSPPVSFSFSFR